MAKVQQNQADPQNIKWIFREIKSKPKKIKSTDIEGVIYLQWNSQYFAGRKFMYSTKRKMTKYNWNGGSIRKHKEKDDILSRMDDIKNACISSYEQGVSNQELRSAIDKSISIKPDEKEAFINFCYDLVSVRRDEKPDLDDLKKILAERVTASGEIDLFIPFAREWIRGNYKRDKPLAASTVQTMSSTLDKLENFSKLEKEKITMTCFTASLYEKYSYWRREEGANTNTIAKECRHIRAFLGHAENNEKVVKINKMWSGSEVKLKDDNTYLNDDELKLLIKHSYENKLHEQVRDLLIFLCYTGMRISDAKQFHKDMIIKVKSRDCIKYKQVKTGNYVVVPVHPELLPILEKYEYKLPSMIDQDFNVEVKEVCKLAKINNNETLNKRVGNKDLKITKKKYEWVSSHIGRRSLVTNMHKRGNSLEVIRLASGHKSIKTLMRYLGLTDSDKAEQLVDSGYFTPMEVAAS